MPPEEAAAVKTWFYSTRAGGDYAALQNATHGASDAMEELPPSASNACAQLKSAIATFRGDLPVPSPDTQAGLDRALAQLERGEQGCEVAADRSADPATARLQRHNASNDLPEGLTALQDALRRGGLPV